MRGVLVLLVPGFPHRRSIGMCRSRDTHEPQEDLLSVQHNE